MGRVCGYSSCSWRTAGRTAKLESEPCAADPRKKTMRKQTLWLLSGVIILGTASLARADESLSAEEFAARCEYANGSLTLDQNMRVDGGSAELGECQVTIGSFRLEIEHARLSSTGSLRAFGESGGEIRVENSTLAQSEQALGPVNILLRAHRVRIEATTLDFSGTVHLETGPDNHGRVYVLDSTLQSVAADIRVGSSGRGHEGLTRIEDSWLSAQVDISVLASSLVTGGRGEVSVEDCVFDSSGTITLETGDAGRTEVRGSARSRQGEDMGSRIHAATTVTIVSGTEGQSIVHGNRIVGEEEAHILSGGRTRVQGNDFIGSGSLLIEGPRCEARDNNPPAECSLLQHLH